VPEDLLEIDALPVRRLHGATMASDWERRDDCPEWAKDLTPEHVRDVLDWVLALERTVAL
jgi:hypothetical protein